MILSTPVISLKKHKMEDSCVVRIRTSSWSDRQGIHLKKDIILLKRKSKGFNILEEDISNIGANEVVSRLINLDECKDGLYIVTTCNEKRDWESGYVDDYDYRLVPYTEPTDNCNLT